MQKVATGNHRASGGHLTFRGNLKDSRYGWLRLTPAYSLNLVDELLDGVSEGDRVLDPFCGTGTTALLAGQRGIDAVTTDINPFLIWLTKTKTATYSKTDLAALNQRATEVAAAIDAIGANPEWLPPLHQIEKWWDEVTLHGLGRAMAAIKRTDTGGPVDDLLRLAFCRSTIERAAVSFGHQSMSFKKRVEGEQLLPADSLRALLCDNWRKSVASFRDAAAAAYVSVQPEALLLDARALCDGIQKATIARVITSPPYPNRMSYIRELRPYLYWLSYLTDAKQAAELDWTAIGGTWGMATSRVGQWKPTDDRVIAYKPLMSILRKVARGGPSGPLLGRYIHKYFFDMVEHVDQLRQVMKPGGIAYYIVGNSKFYGTLLPVQDIYAAMFQAQGFEDVKVRAFRKRSSKRELFEFLVEARRA